MNNGFFDKRLENDKNEKGFVLMLVDGDIETHYVQPVKSVAYYDSKSDADLELNYLLNHLKKFAEDGEEIIEEKHEYEDRLCIQVEGRHIGEWWIVLQTVVKSGTLNLSMFRIFDQDGFSRRR